MSPFAEVSGVRSPRIRIGLLKGEVPEHAQAGWFNGFVTASDIIELVAEGVQGYTLEDAERVIVKNTGMSTEMAHDLVDAADRLDNSVRVTAETVFEEVGRIGGPRHYENFKKNVLK
ncbi:hypothetical protein KBD75_04415 [Candidatus Woesebacteria bacterium]|nr:hypothetical protein [Candidatus Woesebacteria bacterium]